MSVIVIFFVLSIGFSIGSIGVIGSPGVTGLVGLVGSVGVVWSVGFDGFVGLVGLVGSVGSGSSVIFFFSGLNLMVIIYHWIIVLSMVFITKL